MGISHRPSSWFLQPVVINSPFLKIYIICFVSSIWQSLLHNWPSESNDELCKSFKTCAVLACDESEDPSGNSPNSVALIVDASGSVTIGPFLSLIIFSNTLVSVFLI